MAERSEAFMRIMVGIVSGIILGIWLYLIQIIAVLHWIMTVLSGKRNQELAEFCEIWNTQRYIFFRYMTFVSNRRPFPFTQLEKNLSKFK